MSNVLINNESMTAIANAIRQKKSVTDTYKPSEMAPAILTIDGGGSTPVVENVGVLFVDYDGEEIEIWDKADIASKTSLPTPPAHEGLVFEGWNWTLEEIQSDTTEQVITVGPNYHTESGKYEYIVDISQRTSMYLSNSGTGNYTVDWGDGTPEETFTNSTISHTYENEGIYLIKLMNVGTDSNSVIFDQAYCVLEIRFPAIKSSYNYQLNDHPKLQRVAIPSVMQYTNLDGYLCTDGSSLKMITLNKSNIKYRSIGTYNSQKYGIMSNTHLKYIAVPPYVENGNFIYPTHFGMSDNSSLKYIYMMYRCDSYAYQNCTLLKTITIPPHITTISSGCFYGCKSLTELIIPDTVTTIGASAFSECNKVKYVKVGAGITTLPSSSLKFSTATSSSMYKYSKYASESCCYDFSSSTTIPTMESTTSINIIENVASILVPFALYNDWKDATNWVNYKSRMVAIGSGIAEIVGVSSLLYNTTTNLTCPYKYDDSMEISIASSDESVLTVGEYTMNDGILTIPITSQSVTGEAIITLNATVDGKEYTRTHTVNIKESFIVPSYTVTDVEGAAYNFILNDDGYYESTNKGVNSSAALCKVNISDLDDTQNIIFDCINYGENGYDYGLISNIDTDLSTSYTVDSSNYVFKSFSSSSSSVVQSVTYPVNNISSGYFTIKYRRDGSGSAGNDTLQFKVRFE